MSQDRLLTSSHSGLEFEKKCNFFFKKKKNLKFIYTTQNTANHNIKSKLNYTQFIEDIWKDIALMNLPLPRESEEKDMKKTLIFSYRGRYSCKINQCIISYTKFFF